MNADQYLTHQPLSIDTYSMHPSAYGLHLELLYTQHERTHASSKTKPIPVVSVCDIIAYRGWQRV